MHGRIMGREADGGTTSLVSEATIEFKDQAGRVAAKVTTNAQGYYKVDLPAGVYSYKVQAAGHKDLDVGRGITLQLTAGYAVYNFTLVKGKTDPAHKPPQITTVAIGKLEGQVFEATAEGKLVGIPGAAISLRRDGSPQLSRVLTRPPDIDGKTASGYSINLEAALWRASVAADGFETVVDPKPIKVIADRVEVRDFVLNRTKPQVPSEQGIKGVISLIETRWPAVLPRVKLSILSLADLGKPGDHLTTDSQGSYARALPVGRYQVLAQAEGYRPASSGPRDVLAGRYTVVNLELIPELKNLVLEAAVSERLPGERRRALPGATVLVRRQGDPLSSAIRATTDNDGIARLRDLGSGTYDVLAQMSGFKPTGTRVTIATSGANRAEFILERETSIVPKDTPTKKDSPTKVVRLQLLVREEGSKVIPVPSAEIVVRQQNRRMASGSSDKAGAFESGPLQPGAYEIVVSKLGYKEVVERIYLDRDARREVALAKMTATPLSGTGATQKLNLLVREAGQTRVFPVAGAEIAIRQQGRTIAAGQSDRTGRYQANLLAGAYTINVTKQGYTAVQLDVVISQRDLSREIELGKGKSAVGTGTKTSPMKPGVTLRVRVFERIAGKLVEVPEAQISIKQKNRSVQGGAADKQGHYSVGLGAGTYRIDVSKPGYQLGQAVVTLEETDGSHDIILTRIGKASK